jgi:hypothetical protein
VLLVLVLLPVKALVGYLVGNEMGNFVPPI